MNIDALTVRSQKEIPKSTATMRPSPQKAFIRNRLSDGCETVNGGLITYGYAFRYPKQIDRIFAVYPALDFRSWPKPVSNATLPTLID